MVTLSEKLKESNRIELELNQDLNAKPIIAFTDREKFVSVPCQCKWGL